MVSVFSMSLNTINLKLVYKIFTVLPWAMLKLDGVSTSCLPCPLVTAISKQNTSNSGADLRKVVAHEGARSHPMAIR